MSAPATKSPKPNHDRLRLSAKLVAVIAPFMAKGDPRPYLNAINVRPHPDGGAVIAATNGYIMGVVHDKLAVCEHEVTLQLQTGIVAACRMHHNDVRELVMFKGRLAVVHGEKEVCIQAGVPVVTESEFPRYELIIPSADRLKPGLHGPFQARFIALLQEAIKALKSPVHPDPINFFHVAGAPRSVGVARTAMLKEFVAILMPAADLSPIDSVPGWVHAAQRAASTPAKAAA